MASLRRKPNSKYWIACFTLPNGKRAQRSTKTTNRKTAQQMADRFEEAARLRLTELQARRVIADLHQMLAGTKLDFLSVRAYLDQWLAAKEGTISPTTRSLYESATRDFLDYLGDRADADLVYVTSADIAGFRDDTASLRRAAEALPDIATGTTRQEPAASRAAVFEWYGHQIMPISRKLK